MYVEVRGAMKVLLTTDFPIYKKENRCYTKFAYFSILDRYYNRFGKLSFCCPVKTSELPAGYDIEITDIIEEITPLTNLDGLLHRKGKAVREAVGKADLVLARFASFSSAFVCSVARKMGKPVFAEVMSCGWDGLWNHGLIGKMAAPFMFFAVRKSLKNADYALYVTESFLQKRYPCKNKTVGVSDVVIDEVSEEVRQKRKEKILQTEYHNITLMTSGAVNVWYKGQHFVIRAIPLLNQMGIRVKYYCVGQGDSSYLKKVAEKCGVEDQVVFTGAVSHDEVFRLLDECDIYIQPSLQEGLPRALVEAMSRGCPAIGARTGGIPELLPDDCIVKRKAVKDIANTIKKMLDNGLKQYSEQSFLRASDFQGEKLDVKRDSYFKYVCDSVAGITEEKNT